MPKFSPVRNGRQAISDESLEGIKREGFLHSGANKVLPHEETAPVCIRGESGSRGCYYGAAISLEELY